MKAGWEKRPVSEICDATDYVANGSFASLKENVQYLDSSGYAILVRYTDFVKGWNGSYRYVSEQAYGFLSKSVVNAGDLIMANVGDPGRSFLMPDLGRPMTLGPNSIRIRARDTETGNRFLYYYFMSPEGQDALASIMGGAAQKKFNKTSFRSLQVLLPPLEEQKRILAVLDAAFEGLTRAKENAEANLQNARELFEAGFEAQLESSDAETVTYRFGDTAILEIIDGDRGNAYPKKSEFMNAGYCLFLSTKNVREDGFKFDDCQFVSEKKDSELRKGKLRRRDVVLTTRGTIGNIGLYNEQVPYDQIRINSGMLILRPHEEVLSSDFLFEALRSRVVRSQIAEQTSGAAQPQLPIRTLRELSLVIPKSLKDQATLVSSLRAHQDGCRELEASYCTKLTYVADLRQSLLQKAFAGELT